MQLGGLYSIAVIWRGVAGESMASHAPNPPTRLLGLCHGLDSAHILPQLIPGLSQLGTNRQPHKELLKIFNKKKKYSENEALCLYIQVFLDSNWPYCFPFPVCIYCRAFSLDYTRRNPTPNPSLYPYKKTLCSLEHGQ